MEMARGLRQCEVTDNRTLIFLTSFPVIPLSIGKHLIFQANWQIFSAEKPRFIF
jgi:hypothetical protein